MKSNHAGTGLGEIRNQAIDGLDHQMDINRSRDAVISQGLAYQWSDSQVWHVMIVHDIEMDNIGACRQYVFHLFTQSGKVSCKY